MEVTFTGGSSHVLAREKDSDHKRVFSFGCNDFGQLGNKSEISSHVPVEITQNFPSEVIQLASGGYHTLAMTENDELYGFGKLTKAQLASRWEKGQPKIATKPVKVNLPANLSLNKVYAGSLFTMLEVDDSEPTPAAAPAQE